MKRKLLLTLVVVFSLGVGGVIGYNLKQPVAATPAVQKQVKPPTVAELLKLVNAERAKHGVKPLKLDPRLNASAQMKANDEVAYGYFGHMRDGKFIGQQLIDSTGINCPADSENLSWTDDHSSITAKQAMGAWMASRPHREAMLNPKYTLTGFGIVNDAVVEHFCQQ